MITVLLVSSRPPVLAALRMHVARESDVFVVGEAGSIAEALEIGAMLDPDVVVLVIDDLHLDARSATRLVRATLRYSRIVVVSAQQDWGVHADVLMAGASGFVDAHEAADALLPAIRRATIRAA
jgi:DNA-binding NarL/FixJ family response regulator